MLTNPSPAQAFCETLRRIVDSSSIHHSIDVKTLEVSEKRLEARGQTGEGQTYSVG